MTFVTPIPFHMETNYGLFKLCRSMTGECRPFPSSEQGDCHEDGFCELWRAAAAGMVLAVIIGGLTLFGLLATMCSERRKRAKAWAPLSFMFLIYGKRERNTKKKKHSNSFFYSYTTSIFNGYDSILIQY
ncbi:hypothetical protein INT48_009137 [Thamnidium elegans]|uniref:Uncharacterized protein n=1 Tax=Thamnidium elegans TaxID=101142 RepID=A0A8H7SWS7_9FUNG|nr:hypothetical protein INT48_009137 [Thamnidium elegans]